MLVVAAVVTGAVVATGVVVTPGVGVATGEVRGTDVDNAGAVASVNVPLSVNEHLAPLDGECTLTLRPELCPRWGQMI